MMWWQRLNSDTPLILNSEDTVIEFREELPIAVDVTMGAHYIHCYDYQSIRTYLFQDEAVLMISFST